jgi:hypothetical protein
VPSDSEVEERGGRARRGGVEERGERGTRLGANDQGIGLPLDEAIIFWRRMYGASMTDDKFNKEYKYNIRHGYGQEGKRTNYPPKKWVLLPSSPPFYLSVFYLAFVEASCDLGCRRGT